MSSSFTALGVPADIAERLTSLGIVEPYPIQRATLPTALAGGDICAQSPTGSGKTLAFALPLVTRVARGRPAHPRALVLAPARELAAQIAVEMRPFAEARGRRVATFYGGTGFTKQHDALRRGVDIAVGCPGRLIDLLEQGSLRLSEIEIVVIDEADRMADMGFLPAVRRLLGEIRAEHQTMLFSATHTRDVERVIREYQRNPQRFVLDAPSDDVGWRSHEFWSAAREDRAAVTARLVGGLGSSIVFCRTKHGADRLTRQLSQAGLSAVAIHSDRSQAQRERALALFRDRRVQVLVGTDVAARGIHVEGVDCVVHFDPPGDDDTYVHRSGRTGRAGATGKVVSLVTGEQEAEARKLQKRLGIGEGLRPAPTLPPGAQASAPREVDQRHGHGGRVPDANATARNTAQARTAQPRSGAPRRRPRADAPSSGARSSSQRNRARNGRSARRAS